jgi:uncharacterized protein involved in exopolysaccharide biosynthesis
MKKIYKADEKILIDYKNNILLILKQTDINEEEKKSLNSKSRIELVNLHLKKQLKRFHELLKNHEVNFNNKRSSQFELSPIGLEVYKLKIVKSLKESKTPHNQLLRIKKLKSKYEIEKYCKKKLPKLLAVLIKNGFVEFKDTTNHKPIVKNKSNNLLKIIYTPMGNKR